jgi:hypothetical protein
MSMLQTCADRLAWQEDGTVIFTLRQTLASSRGDLAALTVKRPLLGDLLDNEKQSGDDFLKTAITIASLCDLKLAELDEVDGGDTMVLAEVMSKMLEYGEEGSLLDRHADRLTVTDFDVMLTLRMPVQTMAGEVEEMVVRRPTLKEVRGNQGTTLAASVKLLTVLTGHGPNVLRRLDAVDGMILAEQVNDFLGKSRRPNTGSR